METPPLVEKKRWNEINGILIGPMGELSKTLNMLCGNGSGDAKALKLARKVKEDMFAIGTAVSKRQEESVHMHTRVNIRSHFESNPLISSTCWRPAASSHP